MSNIRWAVVWVWFFASATMLSAETIIIWDFATRDGAKTDQTRSLTSEFEEALVQSGKYVIVERRNFDRLEAVIQNEKALFDIGQLSSSAASELKSLGAEAVIFGDVYDDVASGEVTITVTLQDFQGRKQVIKSVSIRRGLLADGNSRREAMAKLARDVAGITDAGGRAGGKPVRTQANDLIFDVQECSLSDRAVLCRFQIANNGEDRKLFIILNGVNGGWADQIYFANGKTVLYDDFNHEALPVRIQLSNSTVGC